MRRATTEIKLLAQDNETVERGADEKHVPVRVTAGNRSGDGCSNGGPDRNRSGRGKPNGHALGRDEIVVSLSNSRQHDHEAQNESKERTAPHRKEPPEDHERDFRS